MGISNRLIGFHIYTFFIHAIILLQAQNATNLQILWLYWIASGSIEPSYWIQEIKLAKDITKAFEIPGGPNRVSIVDFSTNSEIKIGFEQGKSFQSVNTVLDKLKYFRDGHSILDGALATGAGEFAKVPSSRDSAKILVVITDGYMTWRDGKQNNEFLSVPMNKLKALQVETFAVGIRQDIKFETLKLIASDPEETHVMKASEGPKLIEEIEKATEIPCSQGK